MRRWVLAILCVTALLLAGIAWWRHGRAAASQMAVCRERVVLIQQALRAYVDSAGMYPADLAGMRLRERDFPEGAVCPESHQPYRLLTGGLRPDQVQPAAIVLMEPVGVHAGQGWVLYGDGQIALMPAKRMEAVLKLIQFRPPMMGPVPATTATTVPSAH